MDRDFNADTVAEMIRQAGIPAVVDMTGGEVATLYAGDPRRDIDDDRRFAAVVGPGRYGWGVAPSTFDQGDLWVGRDDDGANDAHDAIVLGCQTERDVADLTIALVRLADTSRILSESELAALGFDTSYRGLPRRTGG